MGTFLRAKAKINSGGLGFLSLLLLLLSLLSLLLSLILIWLGGVEFDWEIWLGAVVARARTRAGCGEHTIVWGISLARATVVSNTVTVVVIVVAVVAVVLTGRFDWVWLLSCDGVCCRCWQAGRANRAATVEISGNTCGERVHMRGYISVRGRIPAHFSMVCVHLFMEIYKIANV